MILDNNYPHVNVRGRDTYAILSRCDACGIVFVMSKRKLHEQQKKTETDKTYCSRCRCKQTIKDKPQCHKEYWNEKQRQKQRDIIRNSEKHKESRRILAYKYKGSGNPMFGRRWSEEQRKMISQVRVGKIHEKATAWKGGKFSLLKSVKEHLKVYVQWHQRVCERDGYKCVVCGSTLKVSDHHLIPISTIIRRIVQENKLSTEQEQYNFLIQCPEVIDQHLANGVALCKNCHRRIHINWGSHQSKTISIEQFRKEYEQSQTK